jgi:hypothetical protein
MATGGRAICAGHSGQSSNRRAELSVMSASPPRRAPRYPPGPLSAAISTHSSRPTRRPRGRYSPISAPGCRIRPKRACCSPIPSCAASRSRPRSSIIAPRSGIVRFAPDPYDLGEAGLANVHAHVTNTALHRGHPGLVVSEDASQDNVGAVWSLRGYLERLAADGRDVVRLRAGLKELVRGFLRMVAADGLFARQARAAPRRAFPPKLFGLDVLVDADGEPWLIEAQRKPALSGSALVKRVNGQMFRTIFEMSCGQGLDDSMPGERIALIAKDRGALQAREAEIEAARRGLFEPLG